MKRKLVAVLMVLVMMVCSAACGGGSSEPKKKKFKDMSAGEIVEELKAEGQFVGETVEYTVETDPNELMGQPNQYISKASFADTTLTQHSSASPDGGTVEVFNTPEDAAKRKEYVDILVSSTSFLSEHSFQRDNVLLRLDGDLSSVQAEYYYEDFMGIQ